jgi:hypothetical protein
MKWVRTAIDGQKCHPVLTHHKGKTLCGLSLTGAAIVGPPGFTDRCGSCDAEWRERGRRQRKNKPVSNRAEYRPRFTFKDWEEQA